mgnify:CR=1 FL=1
MAGHGPRTGIFYGRAMTGMQEQWQKISENLRGVLNPGIFKVWIHPLDAHIEGNSLCLAAPSEYVARWLRDRMQDTLRSAAAPVLQVAPENIDIRISCQGAAVAPAAPAAPAAAAAAPLAAPVAQPVHEVPAAPLHAATSRPSQPLWQPSQCSLPLPAPTLRPRTRQRWRFSFDDFVVGPCNAMAVAAAKDICHDGGCVETLFVSSASGLGKTHLLTAIQTEIKRTHPDFVIMYVTCEQFTNELIAAIRAGSTEDFRMKYRVADLLLVDDIQFIAGKESTQEEFFHTFNSLHDAHKQIVIASDRPAKEIKSLEERLRTRFEWGLTADVQPPDFETRVAIVKRKAELLHLDLPEDVAEFIANHLKNNIRQLEGAVKKLNAYYMLEGIQPVISVAQNAIKDILNETQPVPVTIEKIVGEVSRTFNVSPADIRGTKRNANVASARRVAIYILREVTGMSMEEIGREFSGRDHSTIVYSLKTMERDMKNDQHLRETVSDIIKNVKA